MPSESIFEGLIPQTIPALHEENAEKLAQPIEILNISAPFAHFMAVF